MAGMRVLAVAAHPDDEVLGCGGTLTRHALEGDEVHVVILGEGATSRFPPEGGAGAVSRLVEAAHRAGDLMGVGSVSLEGLVDNRFDTLALLDLVRLVERHVDRVRPQIVYTHHLGDVNIDHVLTARAVLTATRPQPGGGVRELFAWEAFSSTEWAFGALAPTWAPNHFVDISRTLTLKLRALDCYEEEVREFPHPRSPRAVEAASARWGSAVGVEAAEAFRLIRSWR